VTKVRDAGKEKKRLKLFNGLLFFPAFSAPDF
jgi:hypothetical protein